jgi:hypothetical protein
MDGLIVVDLAQTDRKTLQRYMGIDGAAAFLTYHGVGTGDDGVGISNLEAS